MTDYDNGIFTTAQKRQLKLCESLDYVVWKDIANPQLDASQMKEIRLGMARNVDYKVYLDINLPASIMYESRKELEKKGSTNVVSAYKIYEVAKKQGYAANGAKVFYKAALQDINLFNYIENDGKLYNIRHLHAITNGLLMNNPNVEKYFSKNSNWRELQTGNTTFKKTSNAELCKKFDYHQLMQINAAMRRKIDILQYIDERYNWRKIKEIRIGLQKKLDVSVYSDLKYNSFQMRELRLALEEGVNLSIICNPNTRWQSIHQLRQIFCDSFDISEYTIEQLKEIMSCLQEKADVRKIVSPGFDWKELREMRLQNKLSIYAVTD